MAVLTLSYHDLLDAAVANSLQKLNNVTVDTRVVIDLINVFPSGLSTQPKPCEPLLVSQLLSNLKKVLAAQKERGAIDKLEIWKADNSKGLDRVVKAQLQTVFPLVMLAVVVFFKELMWALLAALTIMAGYKVILTEKKAAAASVECQVFNTAVVDVAQAYGVTIINGAHCATVRAIVLTQVPAAVQSVPAVPDLTPVPPVSSEQALDAFGCYPKKNI